MGVGRDVAQEVLEEVAVRVVLRVRRVAGRRAIRPDDPGAPLFDRRNFDTA